MTATQKVQQALSLLKDAIDERTSDFQRDWKQSCFVLEIGYDYKTLKNKKGWKCP